MFDLILGNDLFSGILAFVLVLIPAVLVHEIGHFLAGKAAGITILEFGIGLPPRMLTLFSHGGTDYTLNWLPLGGFVRPLGEDAVRQVGDEATEKDRNVALARGVTRVKSVNEATPLQRIIFLAAGAFANLLFAFALFVIVAMIGVPELVGGRVVAVNVAADSPLAQSGLQSGDIIEQVNGETFTTSTDFVNRLYALDGQPTTLTVYRPTDPSVRLIDPSTERLELSFSSPLGERGDVTTGHPVILGIAPDSPADRAGMQPGDLVQTFNGVTLESFEMLRLMTQDNLDTEVTLTLLRGEETLDVQLTPRSNPPEGEGSMGITSSDVTAVVAGELGLIYQDGPPQEVLVSQPLTTAVQYSFTRIVDVLTTIARVPAELLAGTISPEAARPVSVVGIGQMGGVFLQQSVEENQPTIILNFIAIISIALGLTNLLPLPALDGGRIFFVLLEIVRGRPIAPEREGLVHLVGLALLLSATVLIMLNDILNPVTDLLR